MLVQSATELIGNTPLLEIPQEVHGLKWINLYAKLELFNPFSGSLKDRAAEGMIGQHIAQIAEAGQTAIESSSGNTALGLAAICAMYGVPLHVVTNRIRVPEIKLLLRFLGVKVLETAGFSSCPDPSDPNNPLAEIERLMAANPGQYFHSSQYTNPANSGAHFSNTGPEIATDLSGAPVDYFITGLGTAGSSLGAGEYLRQLNPDLKIIGVVARKGQLIPGLRTVEEMWEVGLFDKSRYSDILPIDTNSAIDGVVVLSRKLGLLAGPSSGAAYMAALNYLKPLDAELTEKRNAVIIICDRIEKYLSFLQQLRPELFGFAVRKPSPLQLSLTEYVNAPQVSIEDAKAWMNDSDSQDRCIVLDIRDAIGYKAGHIPGSINFRVDRLDETCEYGLPFSKSNRVLFVCPTGEESLSFAQFISQRGIRCASLKGGFVAWRASGAPVEKS